MTVRQSLRWKPELQDPAEILSADEREERKQLAWTVFILLLAGIATAGTSVLVMLV